MQNILLSLFEHATKYGEQKNTEHVPNRRLAGN